MKLIIFISIVIAVFATLVQTITTVSDTVYDEHDNSRAEEVLHTEDDTATGESQDSEVQIYVYPDSDGQSNTDKDERPRIRTRNRNGKRRRRLRKRPRTTTPTFLEEYEEENRDTLIRPVHHEHESLPTKTDNMEPTYKRRRPKRRRRPTRRPQYIDNDYTLDLPLSYSEEQINPDSLYLRNGQRRRRKGSGHMRMRNKQQTTTETHEIQEQEIHSDITLKSNTTVEHTLNIESLSFEEAHPFQSENKHVPLQSTIKTDIVHSTVPTILITPSAFTPSEITDFNHKLQSLSLGQETYDSYSDFNFPNKYSIHDNDEILFSSTLSSVPNIDETMKTISLGNENTVTKPSFTKYNKEYTITHQTPKPITTTTMVEFGNKLSIPVSSNNIEKILKNRKNLFSTSKRLPPTSAVIRRRLRPRLHRNSSSIVLPINNLTKPLISPTHLNTDRKACEDLNCSRHMMPSKNEIIPSLHLPVGFLATPKVLSLQHLTEKIMNESREYITKKVPVTTIDQMMTSLSTTKTTIVSTLTTRPPMTVSTLPQVETTAFPETSLQTLTTSMSPPTTTVFTTIVTYNTTNNDSQTSSQTTPPLPSPPTMMTMTTMFTTPIVNGTQTLLETEQTEKIKMTFHTFVENNTQFNEDITGTMGKMDNLKLTSLILPNVKDDILDLLKSESGKARVSRILELRNMTLNELLEHRERGSSQLHLAEIFSDTTPVSTASVIKLNTESTLDHIRNQNTTKQDKDGELKDVYNNEEYNLQHTTSNVTINKQLLNSETETNHNSYKSTIVIPNPTLIASQNTFIQFPDDGILGAFPKFISDTLNGKQNSENKVNTNTPEDRESNLSTTRHGKNIPTLYNQYSDKSDPKIFDSMPQFDTDLHLKNNNNYKISPYPDWNVLLTQNFETSTGINNVISLHNDAMKNSETQQAEDIIFLNEGDEAHVRNRFLGSKIIAESGSMDDNDYPERRAFPENAKSTLAVSIAILGLAIFGFLSVLVSCRIQQRRTRLRTKNDILCEHLHIGEDLHSSQHSLNPVLKKTSGQNIPSNISSNRHYYLWRTLRKTFQYE